MAELDDDTFTDLAEEERRRASRRILSGPAIRFILALIAIVVVIAVGGLLIRSWLHSREVSSYEKYITAVRDILKESDAAGTKLTELLNNPGDATRRDVQIRLDQFIQTGSRLTERAKALPTPGNLKEAQQWFVATMQLRSRGLENLKPLLMNALEVRDVEVSSEQIARQMQMLVFSDLAYEEFFVTRATNVLNQHDVRGVSVPSTSFVADSDLGGKARIKEVLVAMKSSSNLQSIHGVALNRVVALPAEKVIEPGGTYNLQATDKLAFAVYLENQGNLPEKDVPVTIKVTSPGATQPQIVTCKVPALKAKEKKEITVKGINPADYGETALLRVDVGPVPGEKNRENNYLEAHVIFIL